MKTYQTFSGTRVEYLGFNPLTGAHYINGSGVDVYYKNPCQIGMDNAIKYKNTALEFAHTLNNNEIYDLNKAGLLNHSKE